MQIQKAFSTILCAFILTTSIHAEDAAPEVALVKDGKTKWSVYLPKESGVVERFAAGEFKKYFEKISDAKLQDAKQAGSSTIQIGLRQHLKVKEFPAAKSGFDGYSILISPKQIVIAGDNERGVLYGVYDLLERLGCRWYQHAFDPKDPESIPKKSNLSLAGGQWSEAGAIKLRIFNGSAFFFDLKPDLMLAQMDWAAKNRYNGVSWQAHHRSGAVGEEIELMKSSGTLAELDKRGLLLHGPGHSFPYFLSTEKYFADHPEWFGLYDGKRRKHGGELPLMNYCWSNADANNELIKNIETFLKNYPQVKILLPVWIDGGGVCQCENCTKRGAPNLIIDLFNQLSERMEKSAPGVWLESVTGYGPLQKPPQGAKPNGKWSGLYAHWGRNHNQSYSDTNYAKGENLKIWASYFKEFSICSYYATTSHQPLNGPPFLHALENDTKYQVTNKIRETLTMQYPHGFWWNYSFNLASAGRHAYYFPDRNPRDELRDYALSYFGPDAGPIVHEYFQKLSGDLDVSYRASRGDGTAADIKWLQTNGQLLRRAVTAAGKDKTFVYRAKKLRASHQMLVRWGNGKRYLQQARAQFDALPNGKITHEDVIKPIEAGRAYAKDLLAQVARTEKEFPGTTSAEWLESWYVNRVLLAPLAEIEKKLNAGANVGN